MFPAFENLCKALRQLPGLGARSAERITIHLLAERPDKLPMLLAALENASQASGKCPCCGNLTESGLCFVCADARRDTLRICVVESVSDLLSIEKSASWTGTYHVLHGRISPLRSIGPEQLNLASLRVRVTQQPISEVLLALPNDVESEATCHYIQETVLGDTGITPLRIGFGLPSGSEISYADALTLRNAMESRRSFR